MAVGSFRWFVVHEAPSSYWTGRQVCMHHALGLKAPYMSQIIQINTRSTQSSLAVWAVKSIADQTLDGGTATSKV